MGALATDVQPGGWGKYVRRPLRVLALWGRYGRRPLRVLALVALIDAIDRASCPAS